MYERILRLMREKIRTWQYVMTLHAEDEMNDDDLSIFDVERAILTGDVIERQEDHATGEWRYFIAGQSIHSEDVEVIVKISVTEKLVIIAVYKG